MTGFPGTPDAGTTRSSVVLGRVMVAAAFVLSVYGSVALIWIRRSDHFLLGAGMFVLLAIGFGALAWLAVPLQPHNLAVWIPLAESVVAATTVAAWATATLITDHAGVEVSAEAWSRLSPADIPVPAALGYQLIMPGASVGWFLMLTLWLLVFPDGELPSPRWRVVAWGAVAAMAALMGLLIWGYRPSATTPYGSGGEIASLVVVTDIVYGLLLIISGICVVSLVLRYRRSSGEARLRYRWVLFGTGALYAAAWAVDSARWQLLVAFLGVTIGVGCYGVAITRHRLYDIDLVVSRALAYGTLALFIGSGYVAVVVTLGGVLGSGVNDTWLSMVAMALVAIAFEPVRVRVQRWANRLVYGPRATPYEVLSDLIRRLHRTTPARPTLERMVELVAEGTGALSVSAWLAGGGWMTAAAGWPEAPDPAEAEAVDQLPGVSFPVRHDGELVGTLQVVKHRGDHLRPIEHRLVTDLAASAGLILRHHRLAASLSARASELRASRRRLVEVQDVERRRLERELHDGAQQLVEALKTRLASGERAARVRGADAVADILATLVSDTQVAVDEIGALARGIYPSHLESGGLAAAVQFQAATLPTPVDVSAVGLGRYSRDIESAIYFSTLEALANAVKHGAPSRIAVKLDGSDGRLQVVIDDDGTGFDLAHTPRGMGIANIRDRTEALGGDVRYRSSPGEGTTVTLTIPLEGATRSMPRGPAALASSLA